MLTKQKNIVLLHGIFTQALLAKLRKLKGKKIFVLEGRPGMESSRHTCAALLKQRIKPTLISDNMAGFLFYKNLVKEIWLSYQAADRAGALCNIGGLILGVLGKKHNVPVHVYPAGKKIRCMGRQKEILFFNGIRVAPVGIKGYIPLMEWVPAKYIRKRYTP